MCHGTGPCFQFRPGRLLNLKNDAKTERIKAQTHTQKTNDFFLSVKTLIGGSLKNEEPANIGSNR